MQIQINNRSHDDSKGVLDTGVMHACVWGDQIVSDSRLYNIGK